MNAKRAKALRRIAEAESIGWPERGLVESPRQSGRHGAGLTAAVAPRSTRAMYLELKKAHRKGAR